MTDTPAATPEPLEPDAALEPNAALDDAVSALLDGEATADERALAETDAGRARLAAFSQVRDAVGDPVEPLSPERLGALLGIALAAADEVLPAPVVAPVLSIDEARQRRSAGRGRVLALAGAAAAVLVAVVGVVTIQRNDRQTMSLSAPSSNDKAASDLAGSTTSMFSTSTADAPALATTAPPVGTAGGGSASASGGGTGASTGGAAGAASPTTRSAVPAQGPTSTRPAGVTVPAASTTAPPPRTNVIDGGDLGQQDDLDALAQRVAAAIEGSNAAGGSTTSSTGAQAVRSDVARCEALTRQSSEPPPLGDQRYRAVATYQGHPSAVLGYDAASSDGQPPRVVVVVDRQTCQRLATARA